MKKRTLTVGSLKAGQKETSAISYSKNEPSRTTKETTADSPSNQSVHLVQNKTTFSVNPMPGQTLLNSALEQNQPLDYKCTKGTCGRCTVQILNGSSFISPPNQAEKDKLKAALKEGFRLACQAVFSSQHK